MIDVDKVTRKPHIYVFSNRNEGGMYSVALRNSAQWWVMTVRGGYKRDKAIKEARLLRDFFGSQLPIVAQIEPVNPDDEVVG